MGDGKKLKEILDSKGTNVRQIAKTTGISATTLYSIIQKDSNIRFDFALRLANELEIDVNEICSASPFSGAITEEEIYPTLPNGLNGALDGNRVKTYLKNSTRIQILFLLTEDEAKCKTKPPLTKKTALTGGQQSHI